MLTPAMKSDALSQKYMQINYFAVREVTMLQSEIGT